MTKHPKIIFLDIDGPMIPYRCLLLPGQTPVMTLFDPVAVSLLNDLCEKNHFKIVLHTSWVRIMGGKPTHEHCIKQGIKAEHFHEDAWTDENIIWRYTRVAEWLERHPEITEYCMVDDDPYQADVYSDHPHPEGMSLRMVLVNYYVGFMFQTYIDIMAILKDENEELGRYAKLLAEEE